MWADTFKAASRALTLMQLATILISCATPKPYDKVRVAILDINGSGGAAVMRNGHEEPLLDMAGVRAVLEHELLQRNITVVDEAELKAVLKRYADSLTYGIRTTATVPEDYQPAATHGIIVKVQANTGLLTIFSLGLLPQSFDTTARMVDLRTGEVRASVHSKSLGSIFSSRGAYRGIRRAAQEIAERLREIQDDGRHLRRVDWPSGFEMRKIKEQSNAAIIVDRPGN